MQDKKVPYSRKPEDMQVDDWQAALRKQFAHEQKFKFKNIGNHPVFSDFEVFNPASGNTYKVSIRDNIKSYNFCSCPDFTINGLGTCKHIEYVLHYFESYKKYQRYLNKPYNPGYSSLSIFYGKERKIRLKKADQAPLVEQEKKLFDENGFLKPGMIEKLDAFIHKALDTDHEFRVYPDVYDFIEQHKQNKQRKQRVAELFPEGSDSRIFDSIIHATLYPYQKEGVQRIVEAGRILLADEMGLGKTIQAIAATEILARHFGVKKVLIICPTSLKFQWKREIEKFTNRDALVVEGLIHKRKDLYTSDSFYKIISYGLCRNDLDYIHELNADLVIMDEAQRIKNWKTRTAQSVKKIVSDYAIVLTGTPLENRIDELHSIVEYIDRFKLGPLFRFLDKHQILDSKGKLQGYTNLRSINQTLDDILLRRTKKEIIDQLPGRVDKHFFVEMTPEQRTDHESYYDTVSKLVHKWIRLGYLTDEERQKLLICLNCMRMVSNTTYILNQKTNHGNKIGELSDLLNDLLEDDGNKMVIFSQWKRMFDLVIALFDKLNVPYVYLNGDVPAQQRNRIMEEFRDNPDVKIFLSTDAGGVGVNLQSANILINLDLPWNPAVLDQRIARIYRLGQKKHISVFNFISKLSIEHRILHLLDFKRSVFTGAIEEEGQDEVMLEGFMESVRALTEVNVEERHHAHEVMSKPHTNGHDETGTWHRQENGSTHMQQRAEKPGTDNTEDVRTNIQVKTDKRTGFFNRIRRRIGKFLSRVVGGK